MKSLEELLDVPSITIAGEEYEIDMKATLHVDSSNLKYEFERHTKLVAIVGFAYERSLSHSQRLEVEMERLYALCDARARTEATIEGGKKPTEAMVENMAKTSIEYQAHQNKWLDAKKEAGLLKALRDAVNHRKDVLVGLAANYRAELQSEPTLRQD